MKSLLKRLTQRLRRVTRKVAAAADETGMVMNHVSLDRTQPADLISELRQNKHALVQMLGQLQAIRQQMS